MILRRAHNSPLLTKLCIICQLTMPKASAAPKVVRATRGSKKQATAANNVTSSENSNQHSAASGTATTAPPPMTVAEFLAQPAASESSKQISSLLSSLSSPAFLSAAGQVPRRRVSKVPRIVLTWLVRLLAVLKYLLQAHHRLLLPRPSLLRL